MHHVGTIKFPEKQHPIIAGYQEMIEDRVAAGSQAFLLTLMFKPLAGNRGAIAAQMLDDVDRVYRTFLNAAVRHPRREEARFRFGNQICPGLVYDNRPLLIACLDGYCRKNAPKTGLPVDHNDGAHVHGILTVPPTCQLNGAVIEHFDQYQKMYAKKRLLRLHVQPVKTNLPYVVDYGLKGLKTGAATADDIVVFPRAVGEG